MAENNEKLGIGKDGQDIEIPDGQTPLASLNMPDYINMNDFANINKALKETNDKLTKIEESLQNAKKLESFLRKAGKDKLADAELEKIRELEKQKDELIKLIAETITNEPSEKKSWYDYLWDAGVKVAYEGGKIIVSFANGLASGAVKAVTFGLVDPELDALIQDPNTIAYKVGNIVGEIGTGIRDVIHDLTNWEWSGEHAWQTLLDAVGLFPLIGAVKNVDEVADIVKGIVKHGDEAADAVNGGQKLPDGVQYKEYDVNPYVKGQNRGMERIVIGDDGSVWYTNDHYQTFTKMD